MKMFDTLKTAIKTLSDGYLQSDWLRFKAADSVTVEDMRLYLNSVDRTLTVNGQVVDVLQIETLPVGTLVVAHNVGASSTQRDMRTCFTKTTEGWLTIREVLYGTGDKRLVVNKTFQHLVSDMTGIDLYLDCPDGNITTYQMALADLIAAV